MKLNIICCICLLAPIQSLRIHSAQPYDSSASYENHVYNMETFASSDDATCAKFSAPDFNLMLGHGYNWHSAVKQHGQAMPDSHVLYGTAYAQQAIVEHQNPQDCSKAKFMRYHSRKNGGIGSDLHVLGQYLAEAMDQGRILTLEDDDTNKWAPGDIMNRQRAGKKSKFNEKEACKSWDCYFLPLTSCKPTSTSDIVDMPKLPDPMQPPRLFTDLLGCSSVKKGLNLYWWRAQSVTYLMRFNEQTRSKLDDMRSVLKVYRGKTQVEEHLDQLPIGAISAHVRHGDKGKESPQTPSTDFTKMIMRLADGDQTIPILDESVSESYKAFTYPKSAFEARTVFVSTEDPTVITDFKKFADQTGFDVAYFDVKRANQDVFSQALSKGEEEETLESFMNLEQSLTSEAFICTISSNWCRLIDELRMTVGTKAHNPFVSLSYAFNSYKGGKCPPDHKTCYVNWARIASDKPN